jgi:hypothetical protein
MLIYAIIGASLGFGSLPPAPGLSGLLSAAALGTGPSGRRRGPSGPPDDYLGTSPAPLVFSSTGSPLVSIVLRIRYKK